MKNLIFILMLVLSVNVFANETCSLDTANNVMTSYIEAKEKELTNDTTTVECYSVCSGPDYCFGLPNLGDEVKWVDGTFSNYFYGSLNCNLINTRTRAGEYHIYNVSISDSSCEITHDRRDYTPYNPLLP